MQNILLLKRWQLFLILVLPMAWTSPEPLNTIMHSISWALLLWWLYATSFYGQKRILERGLTPMNFKLFRINIVLSVLLTVLASFIERFMPAANRDLFSFQNLPYLLIGIYLAYASIQVVFFCAKTLTKLENNREPLAGEWLTNFILFTIFPIGVWFLQPRIKQLVVS